MASTRAQQRELVKDPSWLSNLHQAVEQAGVKLPYSVNTIMNRWILQMGFPVVTIDTRTGSISQQHFLLDADSAVVPPSEFK